MKDIRHAAIFVASVLLILLIVSSSSAAAEKITVAVFPFYDISAETLDMRIPAVLGGELIKFGFIETVPVEVIRERLHTIEPSFMWGEVKRGDKQGGMVWEIKPEILEEINETQPSRFSLYGNILRFGGTWRIDAFIIQEGEAAPEKSFQLSGKSDDEIPALLAEMSKDIASWLKREIVLDEAEEDIRMYMGGLYSYNDVIIKIRERVKLFPEAVPLRALLLDLYLINKDKNGKEIIEESSKIADMLGRSSDEDIRYLLSLNIDPFDAMAGIYEQRNNWKEAINARKRALKYFPYNTALHKEGLGRSHYSLARSLEQKGAEKDALENYRKAVEYLGPSSEYSGASKEGIERLNKGE